MGEEKKTKSKTKNWTLAIIAFDFVIIAWLFSWSLIVDIPGWSPTIRGQFGDMFGAVNSLFSGLAFAGVIIAIVLQSRELELQRLELKLNRKELKATTDQLQGQKEQMELQNENLRKQNFENTFFQMMKLHLAILEHLSYCGSQSTEGIGKYNNDLGAKINKITSNSEQYNDQIKEKIVSSIKSNYNIYGNYIRNVLEILREIEEDCIFHKEKYLSIFKSQLNYEEFELIFLFGIASYPDHQLKTRLERLSFFQNIFKEDEKIINKLRNFYSDLAFSTYAP